MVNFPISEANRRQKFAYKLVNILHGRVCLGLHGVEDSPAPFLSEKIYTNLLVTLCTTFSNLETLKQVVHNEGSLLNSSL